MVMTASPHHHKSNGMAERYVQTTKHALRKAADSGEDVNEALLAYRQTPLTGMPHSPAQMLFNRRIRGPLPCTAESLQLIIPDVYDLLRKQQTDQKKEYDKSAGSLRTLEEGEVVNIRTDSDPSWKPGRVVAEHSQPRSYIVDNGSNIIRRNRVHLRPIPQPQNTEIQAESPERSEPEASTSVSQSPTQVFPSPCATPRRSIQESRGVLPKRFSDYQME